MAEINLIAETHSDELDGQQRRWVTFKLPEHETENVTSINTLFDCLGIVPEEGQRFKLIIEPEA